jgi:hypothetical protein
MKSIRLLGLLIGLISLLLGCGPSGTTPGAGADIRGSITDIQQADAQSREEGIIGSVLIEGVIEEDTEFDKASVTITDKTRVLEQKGEDRLSVTFESLKIGQRVEARFTGPVMESYPVQATASEIVILK